MLQFITAMSSASPQPDKACRLPEPQSSVCVWGGGQHRVPSQCTHGAGPHRVTVLPQGLVSLCRGGCLCLTLTILGG